MWLLSVFSIVFFFMMPSTVYGFYSQFSRMSRLQQHHTQQHQQQQQLKVKSMMGIQMSALNESPMELCEENAILVIEEVKVRYFTNI